MNQSKVRWQAVARWNGRVSQARRRDANTAVHPGRRDYFDVLVRQVDPDGIVIDMLPFKRMKLDAAKNLLHAQAGALWADIIAYLDQ